MDHARAKEIFRDIQSRPYGVSTGPNKLSNNCYAKGMELLQKLGGLGYTVRGRIGETFWNRALFPERIVDLFPADILMTHFYPEVLIDGEWWIVDPSFQPSMQQYGLTVGEFSKDGKPCFPITRLYSQEESIAYQDTWTDEVYLKRFFESGKAGWTALNAWFQERAI